MTRPLRLDIELAAVLRDVVERHYAATRWRARPGSPPPGEVLWVRSVYRPGSPVDAETTHAVLDRLVAMTRWCGDQNQLGPESQAWLRRLEGALRRAQFDGGPDSGS